MPDDDADPGRPARTVKSVQDAMGKAGPAAAAGYTLVGAILGFAGIGYVIDRWMGTAPWCLVGGLFLGTMLGFYELIKTTWPRR
jgi:F0F1-type ATP synthase assembly protein I